MNSNNLQTIDSFPQIDLLEKPTSIQPLNNLNKLLNGVEIYVKREDIQTLGLGGNKLRKLEYLIADAKEKGADVLIASGGVQSNNTRLTAAAAAKYGIDCEIVLTQAVSKTDEDYLENGNILLEKILGVKTHMLAKGEKAADFIEKRVSELITQNKQPYIIPLGSSSPVGCLGYVSCFKEIIEQSNQLDIHFDEIIVPNGSGGTHAGLLAGMKALEVENVHIKSYTVLAALEDAVNTTFEKAKSTLELIDNTISLAKEEVDIDGNYLGEGYGLPTEEMKNAVRLLARTEGLFLDPVYSGKAFGGLLKDIELGRYKKGTKILFIMTGGTPGLFAYKSTF